MFAASAVPDGVAYAIEMTAFSSDIPSAALPAEPARPPRDLIDAVYAQLHKLACQRMGGERSNHTLQATALVHEAYMRLEATGLEFDSPCQFYAMAAEAMRRILIDHARSKNRTKRGGGRHPLPLNVLDLAELPDTTEILAFDDAIQRLEGEASLAAEVVRFRFYAGLSVDETARALSVAPRTVDREWKFARAWLYRHLHPDDGR